MMDDKDTRVPHGDGYVPQLPSDYAGRAEKYSKGRPSYPSGVVDMLNSEFGIAPGARIADIGAGTGVFSGLLLDAGYCVHAVEPEPEMVAEAKRRHGSRKTCDILLGGAENIPLADNSVDAIVVAQALHWFRFDRAAPEFRRIAKGAGVLLCVWNERRSNGSAFLSELETLLRANFPKYVASQDLDTSPAKLVAPYSHDGCLTTKSFAHCQTLSRDAFLARILSTSFAPSPCSAKYPSAHSALSDFFDRHAHGGAVDIPYDAIAVVCTVNAKST